MYDSPSKKILVIGGGVIGLSIARELHKQGVRQITLVEKGVCGSESSWAAAGMLGPQAEADNGDPFFNLCCESRDLYPDLAAELLDETGVDIELDRSGTLSLAFTDDEASELYKRYQWQRDAGLDVEYLLLEEILKKEPFVSCTVHTGLFFPNDWQVENRKLLAALRRYAEMNGITIVENTRVDRILIENGRVIGVKSGANQYLADKTVLATGAWTSLIKLGDADFPVNIEPVRGQMICLRTEIGRFEHVIYSRRGYIVPRSDGRILAGSTSENAGFESAVTDEATASLQKMAAEISPFLGGLDVADRWSGLRPHALDGLPVLGEIEGVDGLFIATAHYRNGILLAPLTARLAANNLVNGTDSAYFREFGPNRFRPRGVGSGN